MSMRRNSLMASVAVGALVVGAASAMAGGFAIREQSAVFQGTSFAGNGAGGALSSMFWNPAALGEHNKGLTIEAAASFILPNTTINSLPGSSLLAGTNSGNIGQNAFVPASYTAYALSQQLVVGMSVNAPVGLSTAPTNRYAGSFQATNSDIRTVNFTPSVAYNIMPNLTIAAGVQIELIKGNLNSATTGADASIAGKDVAFGYTAGILWKPLPATSVGLGFRSGIKHTLDGTVGFVNSEIGKAGINAKLNTPDTVTFSIRQGLSPQLTALFSAEWTNWSKLDKLDIVCTSGSNTVNVLGCPAAGATQSTLPLGWHDGWMVAGGLEYKLMSSTTVRGGVSYERSPIQNAVERTPRTPDSDRIWGSLGMSYVVNSGLTLDAAYSHVFMEGGAIDRTDPKTGNRLVADVKSEVDIITLGARIKW